jgi:hypothetical protein
LATARNAGASIDLPLSGRVVELLVIARRFRCDAVLCERQIFSARFDGEVLAPSTRRTARLDSIVHHLGLALGGRPAAGFANPKANRWPVSRASRDEQHRDDRRKRLHVGDERFFQCFELAVGPSALFIP